MIDRDLIEIVVKGSVGATITFGLGNALLYYGTLAGLNGIKKSKGEEAAKWASEWGITFFEDKGVLYRNLFPGKKAAYENFLKRDL